MSAWVTSFINGKGGVGKTTLAAAFAAEMAKKKLHVLGADLEQDHLPFVAWAENRKRNGHLPAIEVRAERHATVMGLAAHCEHLVIDTAGFSDDLSIALAHKSHLAVVPMNSIANSGEPTVRLLHKLKADGVPDFKVAVALSGVSGLASVRECREYLAVVDKDHLVLTGYVRFMRSYEAAISQGLAITEVGRELLNDEAHHVVGDIGKRLQAAGRAIAREREGREGSERVAAKGRGR